MVDESFLGVVKMQMITALTDKTELDAAVAAAPENCETLGAAIEVLLDTETTQEEIDDALAETGMRIFTETLGPKETLPQRLEKVKQDNRELNEARAAWMTAHGYPVDYTDIHYECKTCQDTGFVGQKLCGCFRKQLVLASFESSGIGNLIQTQSFETFDSRMRK